MSTAQSGIFALGTPSHAYLEFDLQRGKDAGALIKAMADVREPRTTIGGVNFVSGFRPELWRSVVPEGLPGDLTGFNQNLTGPDGYVMPATQHDAVLWLSGSAYDVVFEVARKAIAELAALASIVEETTSWPYMHDRDLTGFIDGTENHRRNRESNADRCARARPHPRGKTRRVRDDPALAEVGP